MSFEQLNQILNRDGFVIFICGPKEKGKTDFALLLAEICYLKKFRTEIATNIKTETFMISQQITNFPDLEAWLKHRGRKLYVLDETGKILKKMRFMAEINQKLIDIIQLIRHYDAGFIGIAPSEKLVDSMFLNTDILDLKVRKLAKDRAKVWDYLENESYFLSDIPRTKITFNSKDLANFTMKKEAILSELPLCCQIATSYGSLGNMKLVGDSFGLEAEEVRRLLQKHCQHSSLTIHTSSGGIEQHQEPIKEAETDAVRHL